MLRTLALSFFFLSIALAGPAAAQSGSGMGVLLPLQDALTRGLEYNLDLQVMQLEIPIGGEEVVAESARFDPVADASLFAEGQKTPSSLLTDRHSRTREYAGLIGLSKEFRSGLTARLSLESSRLSSNAASTSLDPQYRSFLFLDFTQPLLRDFGSSATTADLHIAETGLLQARYGYLDQAQRLAEEIERAYLELGRTGEILRLRIESRELASTLLAGNRSKFEAGIVPITEVQEAETAVAARDEQVVFARQQMESTAHRLRNLLEIGHDDPLAGSAIATEPLPGIDQSWPGFEPALEAALADRPDLQRRQLEIAARQIRLEFYKNQRLPRLDLDASLGVNGLSGDERSSGTISGSEGSPWRSLDRAAGADGYEWFAGMRFSYPLGNRAAEARYRLAGHEKRQALYSLKSLENTVETEVRNALTEVARSFERVQVAERFQQLADTTLAQEMERLAEGLTDTFRILDFQTAVIDARVRKINALVDFNQGLASLYRAMGANLKRRGILHALEKEIPHDRS